MSRIRFSRPASFVFMTLTLIALSCGLAGCGGGSSSSTPSIAQSPSPSAPNAATVPVVQHVAVVVLENHGFSSTVNSSAMPFLNGLIKQGGLAANYFANSHPSLPNYFALTTGQTLVTEDASPVQTVDNVVRVLTAAGKSWKGYFQSLPSTGYMGLDVPPYVKHHNPFAYLSDVVNSSAQQQNLVAASALAGDASANRLPNYMFIVPDDANSGAVCPGGGTSCSAAQQLAVADAWLSGTVNSLMSSSSFQQSGILIVTFDEADTTDSTNGGGHIAAVLVGTKVKAGFQSGTLLQHPATLRLTLQALGVGSFPGSAASAPSMAEFFQP